MFDCRYSDKIKAYMDDTLLPENAQLTAENERLSAQLAACEQHRTEQQAEQGRLSQELDLARAGQQANQSEHQVRNKTTIQIALK